MTTEIVPYNNFLDVPGCTFSVNSLEIEPGMSYSNWEHLVVTLMRVGEGVQWWIGDALTYGEKEHGELYAQVEAAAERLGMPTETLRNYEYVARQVPNVIRITNVGWSLHQAVASLPEEKQRAILKEASEKKLTARDVQRLARQARGEEKPITQPPAERYQTIVIDPPWEMEKIEREVRPNQHGFDYPTMTEDELANFPLPEIAAEDCHLYLWTTHKHLPLAMRLAEVWGFRYECLMTWVKNVGFTPYSWMRSTEHVLFCRKGNLQLQRVGLRLDFQAKVREHSRKPDEFYQLVKEVSPGPRIDVFSREKREGFDQWGNEVDKFEAVA